MPGADRSVLRSARAPACIVWKREEWNRTPRRAWNLLATQGSGRWFSSQTRPRPVSGKVRSVVRSRCWQTQGLVVNGRAGGDVLKRRNGRRGILACQDRSLTVAARKATAAARKTTAG